MRALLARDGADALARAWVEGDDLDLRAAWLELPSLHALLPASPFERRRHWYDASAAPVNPDPAGAARPQTSGLTHQVAGWLRLDAEPATPLAGRRIGVASTDRALVEALTSAASSRGACIVDVTAGPAAGHPRWPDVRPEPVDILIVAATPGDDDGDGPWIAADPTRAVLPVLGLLSTTPDPSMPPSRLVISQPGLERADDGAVAGLLAVANHESPGITHVAVRHATSDPVRRAADLLDAATRCETGELCYDDGPWARALVDADVNSDATAPGTHGPWSAGTYLVTGGRRGLGRLVAERLALSLIHISEPTRRS